MDPKSHWENIYRSRSHKDVSWYAGHIAQSLKIIQSLGLKSDASILDVGGGASTLVDDLMESGHTSISVLDVSAAALDIARIRLAGFGDRAARVVWLEADVLTHVFPVDAYDLWHDRAVFHFLTADSDRQTYRAQAARAVKPGGHLLMSVFADDGPEKCSGIQVRRHGQGELEMFFEADFKPVMSDRNVHVTPAGVEQRFVTVLLRKK